MATYEQLASSSFTDVVVPFVVDNGLGQTDSCTKTLTGYTVPDTPYTFTAILSALDTTYIGASMDKLIWDMGDGTFLTGVSVTKHYEYPGTYYVTTIFTDQNGVTHKNRMSQKIRVMNYLPDSLVWYTKNIADPLGAQPERIMIGEPSNDLSIYRMNSWQSWPAVSGDGGYYINLYATGSRSRPLSKKQYYESADCHFVPSWRFVQGKTSKEPMERVQTDNEFIYVKVQDGDLVRVKGEESGSFFVGTSGYTTVNYIDDNASRGAKITENLQSINTQDMVTFNDSQVTENTYELGDDGSVKEPRRDVVLYASFDTSKFPLVRADKDLTKYELLAKDYFQVYETQKVGLPVEVKYNTPSQLSLTCNGIPEFGISFNKFIDSPISLCTRTMDASGNIIASDNITNLRSRWGAPTTAFSAVDITTDTLTAEGYVSLYLSGANTRFDMIQAPYNIDDDHEKHYIGSLSATNWASKNIVLELLNTDGSTRPNDNRFVTLLFSELHEEDQRTLLLRPKTEFSRRDGAKPRWWRLRRPTGFHPRGDYYGYVYPESSTYDIEDTFSMELMDVTETFNTPGSYLCHVNLNLPTVDYKVEDNRYRFVAQTLITPPATFGYDVLYYYITNPSNDVFYQIKPTYHREYSYGEDGFTQTYTPPISTQTPGNSGLYGFAVEPKGEVIAVDGDTDKIIRYWRSRTSRGEMAIKDMLPTEVRSQHYPEDPDAYGYTPSSVCLDENLDYWVTLYDTVSTIKVSGVTNEIIGSAVPPEMQQLADTRTTNPSSHWSQHSTYQMNIVGGRPGEYGEGLIRPTVVETCKNNSVVVSYSNPISSFLIKYDSDGNMLHRYDMPGEDRYFTGEICVDASDNIWAIVESTGLTYDGAPDMSPLKSYIYCFNRDMVLRNIVDSVKGTNYQDMLKPLPHRNEPVSVVVNMRLVYNYNTQEYIEDGLLIVGFGGEINPTLTLYEGNTYYFTNQYYNNGKHPLTFRTISSLDEDLPLDSTGDDYRTDGSTIFEGVRGYETAQQVIEITRDTPRTFLLIDNNFENSNKLLCRVIKKPVIDQRKPESFDMINNATFLTPDTSNNVWFSWGSRYVSKIDVNTRQVLQTLAVGQPYEDLKFDAFDESTHDRRSNAQRRSAIEGLGCDTGDNLLVIQNNDKTVYSINTITPQVSAFVKVPNYQIPYEEFNWVPSISSERVAGEDDFLLYPDTHMTKEQIEVFLKNTRFEGTDEQKIEAYTNYMNVTNGVSGNMDFRTTHASYPVSAAGFEQELRALGDWTGFRWINKYTGRPALVEGSTTVSITGASNEFRLIPQTVALDVVKKEESVDFAQVIRSYMLQPTLRNNPKLYNEFIDGVFGTKGSTPESLGKKVYEKIANYVQNTVDIDTCTVDALEGLAKLVNYNLLSLGYKMPAGIQRLVDLLSVSFTKLRGTRVYEQQDFEKYGNWFQNTAGVNLGPELMFILDWNYNNGYSVGDYTRYNGKYYECVESTGGASIHPDVHVSIHEKHDMWSKQQDSWVEWSDGLVRTQSKSYIDRIYKGKSDEWRKQYYESQPVKIKLVQNITLTVGEKYVLKEENTNSYRLIKPMAISYRDGKNYDLILKVDDDTEASYIEVQEPDNDEQAQLEHVATISNYTPVDVLASDLLTIMGDVPKQNKTFVLFKNRTYTFDVDCPGHPIIITENPGPDAEPLGDFVSGQGTEVGRMVLRTDPEPINNTTPPDRLYYQSVNDPSISGTILIRDIDNVPGYSTLYDGVTSYNLNMSVSSHNDLDRFGWGMSYPDTDSAWQHYSIYEYVETENPDYRYVNNLIDWEDEQTTISFSNSSYDDTWNHPVSGLMDLMIERTLRDGLDLFEGLDSAATFDVD